MANSKVMVNSRCSLEADKKRLGEQAEAVFLQRAVRYGLAIAKPWGDSERYDFVIDGGGRFWRVQVKSCRRQQHKHYGYPFKAHSAGLGYKKAYTADQVDILAAYIVPEDCWYIIPLEALNSALTFTIHTYPAPSGRNCGRHRTHDFEPYREAWWILSGGSAPAKPV